jgi:hypothetical protein
MAEHDDCEMTRLARLAVYEKEEPGQIEANKPGSLGCHEAFDRSFLAMEDVGEWLLGHPAIVQNAGWFRLASEAHDKLWDLYQAIGAEHVR